MADFIGFLAGLTFAVALTMITDRMLSGLFLLAALTTGCGSSDSGAEGASGSGASGSSSGASGSSSGGKAGSSGKAGGGNGGAGAVDPGGPLLERPAGDEYDCSVSRPI